MRGEDADDAEFQQQQEGVELLWPRSNGTPRDQHGHRREQRGQQR